MCRNLIAVTAVAAIVASAATPVLANKTCKPLHDARRNLENLWFPTQALAQNDARVAWHMQVAVKHTAKFANWDNAENRRLPCNRKTSALGVNTFACNAIARPCAFD